MERYIMKGGDPLVGEVTIGGAESAALGILTAPIITDEDVLIENLPGVRDIDVLLEVIQEIGARVERVGRHTIRTNASDIEEVSVDDDYTHKIRVSYYFIGALLKRCEGAQVPLPGGCNIGSRPIDLHIKGFRALGVKVDIERGAILAHVIDLVGSHIYLDKAPVGVTINIMMAAALAEGQTTIENMTKEPHVIDAANFLDSMGANIKGTGMGIIHIKGARKLHGTEYSIIPDQIGARTFMRAAAVTRGDVMIKNIIPKYVKAISTKLIEISCKVVEFDDAIRMVGKPRQGHININTLSYPGFPTDIQPQTTVALALADGTSIVTESIFENRFRYVDELARMGSSIRVEDNVVMIDDVKGFTGAQANTPDLHARAALVTVGLTAEGYTTVDEIGYIQRGHEHFEEKLKALSVMIELADSEKKARKFKLEIG